MVKKITLFLLSSFLLLSCAPTKEIQTTAVIVSVFATPAAQPWLTELYSCADQASVILKVSSDDPEIYLRVGEPEILLAPAFEIDEEEILVVTSRESPTQNLTIDEVQSLFAGQGDPAVEVWVYSSDADVQILFDQFVMKGRSVSSFAKVAPGPQEMSDLLNKETNIAGILPRHWLTDNVREVYSAGSVPVLAVVKAEPQSEVKSLISCLQNY